MLNQIARIRSIPKEGKVDAITRDDNFVLGLANDNTAAGTKVVFEARDQGSTGQLWIRGPADREGYYFLKNQKSNKYLTCANRNDITIKGNSIICVSFFYAFVTSAFTCIVSLFQII